jgi:hypothetical protein
LTKSTWTYSSKRREYEGSHGLSPPLLSLVYNVLRVFSRGSGQTKASTAGVAGQSWPRGGAGLGEVYSRSRLCPLAVSGSRELDHTGRI